MKVLFSMIGIFLIIVAYGILNVKTEEQVMPKEEPVEEETSSAGDGQGVAIAIEQPNDGYPPDVKYDSNKFFSI